MEKEYLQVRGRIFDIQKYSIHDGPGIRTIVFLKGCPLRCRWCCNPESQEREIQTMITGGKPKTIGRDVTVGEVMDEVMQDRFYYRRSGGGLTLSGGESLMQPDFASALMQAAHERGINTAMESTGLAPFRVIAEKILPHLDLYLMDIKHTDREKHKFFTGVSNELILENAKKNSRIRAESGDSCSGGARLQRHRGGDTGDSEICGLPPWGGAAASAALPPAGNGQVRGAGQGLHAVQRPAALQRADAETDGCGFCNRAAG